MKCSESQLQISAMMDSELSGSQENLLRSHLSRCGECADYAQQQEQMQLWFSSEAMEVDLPPRIWEAVEARIATPPVSAWERFSRWWAELLQTPEAGLALATCLLLLIMSVAILSDRPNVEDANLLAQVETFQVIVTDNPFLSQTDELTNPFFEEIGSGSAMNPFESRGN